MIDYLIVFAAEYLYLVLPVAAVVLYVMLQHEARWRYFGLLFVAMLFADILSNIASELYYNPRPFMDAGIRPLFAHIAENGFPSSHTLYSFVIAFVIYLYRQRLGMALMVIALVVGGARVLAHVHEWVDILGGVSLALAAVLASYYVVDYFIKHFDKTKKSTKE